MNSAKIFALLLILTFHFAQAEAPPRQGDDIIGHDQGNAAGFPADAEGIAWFTGHDRTIHFCMEVAPKFEIQKRDLAKQIVAAYREWSLYMVQKKINSYEEPSRIVAVTCNGSEDLHFFFGLTNPEIDGYRKHFNSPVALSVQTSYDVKKAWGKGFVWFAASGTVQPPPSVTDKFPDWSLPGGLHMILLHELGHVHGVGHVPLTVMSPNIASSLLSWTGDNFVTESKIDRDVELVICDKCETLQFGDLGFNRTASSTVDPGQEIDTRAANFKRLFGREPQGSLRSSLRGSYDHGYVLSVEDAKGRNDFPLHIFPGSFAQTDAGPGVFKSLISDGGVFAASVVAEVTTASITTLSGETLFLSVQRNMFSMFNLPKPFYGATSFSMERPIMLLIEESTGTELLFEGRP